MQTQEQITPEQRKIFYEKIDALMTAACPDEWALYTAVLDVMKFVNKLPDTEMYEELRTAVELMISEAYQAMEEAAPEAFRLWQQASVVY